MSELQRVMHVEDDPSIQAVAKVALEIVGGLTVEQIIRDRAAFAAAREGAMTGMLCLLVWYIF